MRVESSPHPAPRWSAPTSSSPAAVCAANAALAVARLGGRAAFAGPLGDEDDAASNRILADLTAEGVDCAARCAAAAARCSVSLILIDAAGEKSIATRRGSGLSSVAAARRRSAGRRDADAVLVDNRFPNSPARCAAPPRRAACRSCIDLDQATRPDDALLRLGSHVVASAEALRGTTGEKDFGKALAVLGRASHGFLAVTDGETACFGATAATLRHMAGFKVDGRRHARRRRHLSRRLHARLAEDRDPIGRACVSAAPPPRSNARNSAAPPARRSGPRWTAFCSDGRLTLAGRPIARYAVRASPRGGIWRLDLENISLYALFNRTPLRKYILKLLRMQG